MKTKAQLEAENNNLRLGAGAAVGGLALVGIYATTKQAPVQQVNNNGWFSLNKTNNYK